LFKSGSHSCFLIETHSHLVNRDFRVNRPPLQVLKGKTLKNRRVARL
jgi:hypothetical protein